MYSKLKRLNSKGFTLIEIIASIAMLGMVIIVLLPIFPQIMTWTNNTDQELVASNLLGQVVSDVRDESKNQAILEFAGAAPSCTAGLREVPMIAEISTYELNNITYHIKLSICKEPEVALYRTNIQVRSNIDMKLSETYTYIPAGESH